MQLLNRMLESAPGRIINVTSLSHRKLKSVDWSIATRPTPTDFTWPHPTYPVSKLANILFTKELARRLAGTGITTYAAHPGVVATDIWRVVPPRLQPFLKLLKPLMATSEQGARTQIHCAVAPARNRDRTFLRRREGACAVVTCARRRTGVGTLASQRELVRLSISGLTGGIKSLIFRAGLPPQYSLGGIRVSG